MKDNKASFTAADAFPVKVLQNTELIKSITQDRIIPPLHVQLIPTNRCNLTCKFCSCAEEDRSLEMSFEGMFNTVETLCNLGMKSVTITGGGDPLMFKYLEDLLTLLHAKGVKIGLVTNGVILSRIPNLDLSAVTWCRISHSDDREFSEEYASRLVVAMKNNPTVDWAFSYVVSTLPNLEQIAWLIKVANYAKCTHVRLVADLLCPGDVPMELLEAVLDPVVAACSVPAIFQQRDTPEPGGNCRICYLKPVVTPDYKVYACCGAQYALDPPTKSFPKELCLGTVAEFPRVIAEDSSKPFAGGNLCKVCYYQSYNRTLDMLLAETVHKEFV